MFAVAFSPDGQLLASASKDGTARIWDVATGSVRHVLKDHTDEVTCVAFSPDGTRLATGSEDQRVILWDPRSGKSLFALAGHENHVLTVAFSPDGRQLASGGRDNCVRLWDLDTRQMTQVLREPARVVRCIRYSPDGKVLAACDEGGIIHHWNTSDWKPLPPIAESDGSLFAIDFHPDSRRLIAAGRDEILYCVDLEGRQHVRFSALENHGSWIRGAKLAPDGTTAATCNHNGFLRLWDISKSANQEGDALLGAIPGHAGRIWGLDWSPDGKLLVTAGADRLVKLWSVANCFEAFSYEDIEGLIWDVAFSSDSKTLVTADHGGTVRTFDVDSRRLVHSHYGVNDRSGRVSLAVTRNGRHAAVASEDSRSVRYLDLASGDVLLDKGGYPGGIYSLSVSRDPSLLAVGSGDNAATIIELPTGKTLRTLPHESRVGAVTLSPDGRQLVTASRQLRLWDVQTGAELWSRRYHEADPRNPVFSPDGKTIATAVGDDNICLVDASNGELLGSLLSDQGRGEFLAFSPDGNTLAAGVDRPSIVTLWDARTHQELCVLEADLISLLAVAFSPDGKRLVAAGQAPGRPRASLGTGRVVEWVLGSTVPSQ